MRRAPDVTATKDLTTGSVVGHIQTIAAPIIGLLIVGAINSMVDLYFVAQLGSVAVAGVSVGINIPFLVGALVQVLGIGTATLVSHALGRKDHADANLIFNQAMALSVALGVCVSVAGYSLIPWYVRSLAVDLPTIEASTSYLYGLMPGLTLQFALPVITWALRAIGNVRAPMVIYVIGVVVHMVLAPVLIMGWGTGHPLHTAGAGLAGSVATVTIVALLWFYFYRQNHYFRIDRHQLRPIWSHWKRILIIGLPVGGEAILLFLYPVVIFWTIRNFGPVAQAGFGAGSRLLQIVLMPAMAMAVAIVPIIGQNFGAAAVSRVRETFLKAAALTSVLMLVMTAVLQWYADSFLGLFTHDPDVKRAGETFLRFISIALVARGLIYVSSGLFQGLGNTVPPLVTSALSLVGFSLPAILWTKKPGFHIEYIWWLWVATTMANAVVNVFLLRREIRYRLAELSDGLSTLSVFVERSR